MCEEQPWNGDVIFNKEHFQRTKKDTATSASMVCNPLSYIRLLSGSIESGSGIVWAWIVCCSAADYCDTNELHCVSNPHRNMYADSTQLRSIQPLPLFS